ncbi:MAG: pentapeptide repeat-containing protein [Moorea sp. SIO2B7]|nr:pentapeptide repeat-containing protein [Moorena sp. SIO2B7]
MLSAYLGWCALKGDPRDAWIRSWVIAFAATGGTSFYKANLTDADFTKATLKSTDLRKATLIHTCWRDTKKLDQARPGKTYLHNTQVRQLVITGDGQNQNFAHQLNLLKGINLKEANLIAANFEGSDLSKANLQGARLADANFILANLNGANLQDADLSRAKLVQTQLDETDLTGATLTGAYIEEWGITTRTKLHGILCDYVFMRLPTKDNPEPRRKPDDRNQNFEEGEFVDFITPLQQTLDLYHNQVDDPRLIAIAFQQLQEKHPEAEIQTVSVEVKGKNRDKLLLRAETTQEANHSQLHGEYFTNYNNLQALSPQQLHLHLLLVKKNDRIRMLEGMVSAAISRHGVADPNQTGVAGGDLSEQVTVAINQLPASTESDKPGIKELLAQLQEAIVSESNLDDEDKAEALEQVKALAEAGENPSDGAMKKLAKRATTMLKGIIAGLPTAAKLVEQCKELLPMITKLFGF